MLRAHIKCVILHAVAWQHLDAAQVRCVNSRDLWPVTAVSESSCCERKCCGWSLLDWRRREVSHSEIFYFFYVLFFNLKWTL